MANDRHVALINRVAQYVYDNSSKDISLDELSQVAFVSKFHLNRLFASATGCQLGEFVKRCRLEKAYRLIESGETSILDVALAVGYESHSSFSRAFQNYFVITPSELMEGKPSPAQNLKVSPKVVQELSLTPEVIELPEREVVGLYAVGFAEQSYQQVAGETFQKLFSKSDQENFDDLQAIGVSIDRPWKVEDQTQCRLFCGFLRGLKRDDHLESFIWPGGKWAKFIHRGGYAGLWQTIDSIYSCWVIPNDIQLRDCHLIQRYINNPVQCEPQDLVTELYFAIEC